jgi:hypothetical protein
MWSQWKWCVCAAEYYPRAHFCFFFVDAFLFCAAP